MQPGDLHWVEFPRSEGHEQAGRRPAIVMQDDDYAANLSVVFVIPVTAQPANLRFPATVAVDSNATTNLTKSSVALVFQARAIDRRRVSAYRIGKLDEDTLRAIYDTLDRLTGRNRLPASPSSSPVSPLPPPAPPPSEPVVTPTKPDPTARRRRTIRRVKDDD